MRTSKYDLTRGSISKALFRLAIPTFVSQLLQDLFYVVDMIFVGRLGPAALVAVAVSGNLLRLVSILAYGISTGTIILVSQFIGARKRVESESVAMQALMLNVVCALGIGCLGYPLAEFGLWLMGVEPEVIPFGVPYLRVILLGAVTMFLSRTLTAIFRGAGDAVTPMTVLIFSSIVNIVLDPLLIFGMWGFPRLGVVGSAYATVIGQGFGVAILLYLCFRGHGVVSLRRVERRPNLSMWGQIMRLGIFSAMQALLRHGSRVLFIRVVAIFGTGPVAAYAICMRLRILVMHFGTAFSNAVAPMVGQNIGANRIHRAEKSAQLGSILAAVIVTFIGIFLFSIPQFFIGLFTNEPEVIEIGNVYLRFLAATFAFMVVSSVLGRALNGAGDTVSPMTITGVSQFGVGLVLVVLLSQLIGLTGIWWGIAVSNVVQCLLLGYWFRRGAWKIQKRGVVRQAGTQQPAGK